MPRQNLAIVSLNMRTGYGTHAPRSPLDRSRFGLFDLLTDLTQDQLRAIIEDAAKSDASPDTDAGKIGALYNSFMDEGLIDTLDASPIATDLATVRDAKTRSDLAELMGGTNAVSARASFL